MKRFFSILFCLSLLLSGAVFSAAADTQAADITADTNVTVDGFKYPGFLFDKDAKTCYASKGNVSVTLENSGGIGSLYLIFDYEYGEYTVTDNASGKVLTAGAYGFLHEYLDLEGAFGTAPTSVTVSFGSGSVNIGEIYIFSSGQVPGFVQKWAPPLEGGADILMLPTHGDDDQLYFAGLLPYYAGEQGLRVQVAYMTSHRNYTTLRTHEILNGLWAVGVDVYPVFGEFFDFRVDSLQGSYQVYANHGITRDEIIGFVTEQLRRFKPLAVVGHDINGEYGHGMHRVYCDALMAAVELSMDPQSYPESAEKYGTWDVPKTYLHLLEENPIVLNYDVPLERFNGLTAFQVTQQLGFPCHETQQVYGFKTWLNGFNGEITKATQIEKFNPCYFGLYRTTVGPDAAKNDFLENLIPYDEQARLEQERLEQERLEQERLEQEKLERERLEQERLEQERLEKERLEQERLEREKERLEQLEQQLKEQEAARNRRKLLQTAAITGICILLLITVLLLIRKRKKASVR